MPFASRFVCRWFVPVVLAAALAGCSTSSRIAGPGAPGGGQQAFIITTDFSTGGLSAIDVDTRAVSANVAAVHSDAMLRLYGGLIYVVNRFGQDNVQVIDPARGYTTVRQFSTGNGTNPQDIAFASASKAYISRYASTDLLIVDPSTGTNIGTISLAAFADADGLPEMARMAIVGPYLFIACQRLTNFVASNPSMVVVVDIRGDRVVDTNPLVPGVQAITLAGRNPFTDFAWDAIDRELLIGCAGAFGALDGGIERIDPVQLKSLGFAITESALGGDINGIGWNGPAHSYAIVSDAAFNASIVAWSANAGDTLRTVYRPGGYNLADCQVLTGRGELWVARNQLVAPGVLIFRAGPDTLLAGPLNTGLPPNQIAFQ
ncbi:MAG: hypothetical protein HY076_04455 [Candidatus Eisenbacteria bacterium]|uniref:YncE family protein n=1 Tax=Eiseniibacteriota bacterium TaxID=2212470 RepID=A0A9D6L6H3_UNCEI|nr:hypothetical protein [Candidatus Eisenbacteria bacterium]MBI3539506.1 hypothetical protein [Candidatus Eisenbacteria bacterium]